MLGVTALVAILFVDPATYLAILLFKLIKGLFMAILKYLNKVLGAIGGMILYPIKSILVNLTLLLLSLVGTVAALVLIPLLFTILGIGVTDSLFGGLVAGIISFVAVLALAIPFTLISLPLQLYWGIKSFILSIFVGAVHGFEKGLFFDVLNTFAFRFTLFSPTLQFLRGITISVSGREPINQAQWDELDGENDNINYMDLEDVPVAHNHQAPNIDGEVMPQQSRFVPLTPEQINKAKTDGDETLSTLIGRYENLYDRLDAVDRALADNGEMPEDECVTFFDIAQPSLLVKEYRDGERWKIVPASTKIVDKTNVKQWFDQNGVHPLTRERILAPKPYEGKETRYRFYDYHSKDDAQELKEAAAGVRQRLAQLALPSPNEVYSGLQSRMSSFFNRSSNNIQRLDSEEEDNIIQLHN